MSAREMTLVHTVWDIPRLCACDWKPLVHGGRLVRWQLALASVACRFHGRRQA